MFPILSARLYVMSWLIFEGQLHDPEEAHLLLFASGENYKYPYNLRTKIGIVLRVQNDNSHLGYINDVCREAKLTATKTYWCT